MNILIVSATENEILPLVSSLNSKKERNPKLKTYSLKNLNIDVLITGVGIIATTYWLSKMVVKKKYDIALNCGIAGSFDKQLAIGEVVNITQDRFPELGAEDGEKFLTLSEMNLPGEDELPFIKGKLINSSKIGNKIVNQLPKVSGITVNTVHGNETNIKKIISRYDPSTESMEGAAFLYVCLSENIQCVQIRAISNYIEKRNRGAWNVPIAIKNLNEKIRDILNHF